MWNHNYQYSSTFILVFLLTHNVAKSANILFFMGYASHSHRRVLQALADPLSSAGHNITFLTPIPPDTPNPKIHEFCPSALSTVYKEVAAGSSSASMLGRLHDDHSNVLLDNYGLALWDFASAICDSIINSPDMPDWVEKSPKFDLIIIDHPCKECALALVHKFKAKSILFSPMPPLDQDADMYGWPSESSWLPTWSDGVGPFLSNFVSRQFTDPIDTVLWYLSYNYLFLPKIEASFKKSKVFGSEDMPSLADLLRATDLYLVNIHFSTDYARSLPPFVVPVGGIHVDPEPEILPKPIKQFIETEDNSVGFMYVSFGSIIKISELPPEKQKIFVDTFVNFKNVKFLLKWEGTKPPEGLPPNVLTMKWFPQSSVLAHPKCRGFITQGGVVSFQQAFAYEVPIITIPTWGDQPYNARLGVHHGNGIHLELSHLTLDSLVEAVGELLNNEMYARRAKEMAVTFKDRPMSPVDTAVYWTEYVLRHDDLSHLKPLGIHQYWWQRRLLDVWTVIFVIIFFTLFSIFCAIKFALKLVTWGLHYDGAKDIKRTTRPSGEFDGRLRSKKNS